MPGNYTFTLRVTDSATPTPATATRTFTWKVSPLTNSYWSLPITGTTLVYGQSYNQPLLAMGGSGTYTWTAPSGLPPGLSMNSAGVITGSPTNTGSFNFPFAINDGGNTFTANINFNIASNTPSTLLFSNSGNLGTFAFSNVTANLNVSGSPLSVPNYTVSLVSGTLPPGLTLLSAAASGSGAPQIVGMPTTPGVYVFTLQVTDASGNTGYRTFTMTINGDYFLLNNLLPDASTSQSYSQTLMANGATQVWSVALQLHSAGGPDAEFGGRAERNSDRDRHVQLLRRAH